MPADGVSLEIRDLVLRVPGLDRFDARRLAEEVATCLVQELSHRPLRAGATFAHMHLRIPQGSPRHELARLIARQIRQEMP